MSSNMADFLSFFPFFFSLTLGFLDKIKFFTHNYSFNPIQTGLFWSICDPPLFISGTNNARVMKFTHNDHLRSPTPSFDLPRPMMTSE